MISIEHSIGLLGYLLTDHLFGGYTELLESWKSAAGQSIAEEDVDIVRHLGFRDINDKRFMCYSFA